MTRFKNLEMKTKINIYSFYGKPYGITNILIFICNNYNDCFGEFLNGIIKTNNQKTMTLSKFKKTSNKGFSLRSVLFIFSFFIFSFVHSQRPIVTIWNTNINNDNSRSISFNSGYSSFTYSYINLDNLNITGQGTRDNSLNTTTISFPEKGVYKLSIVPNSNFSFQSNSSSNKLLEVSQWGDIVWNYDLIGMFSNCINLKITAVDIPDFSNVTRMRSLFENCTSIITIPQIENWDTSKVNDMSSMFRRVNKFNQSIGNWNTSNVTDMSYMFSGATVFNQPIGNWNTSNVTKMEQMFSDATIFNQPIGNWNTSKVTIMKGMFTGATSFNQPIGNWVITNVILGLSSMFQNATSFNQPIGDWDTSNVTNMSNMFYNASSFNQTLGKWNLKGISPNLYSLDGFFSRSGISCVNYTSTLKGWSENENTPLQFLTVGAENLRYGSEGKLYRDFLMNTKKWKFGSDIFDENCVTSMDTSETFLSKVSFYPNPFTDILNIKLNTTFPTNIDLKIFNSHGSLVFNKIYKSSNYLTVDIGTSLPVGVYIVILKTDDYNKSFRVIKN